MLCHTSIYKANTSLHLHNTSYFVQQSAECTKKFDGSFGLMREKSFRR